MNKYSKMQKTLYESYAQSWSVDNRDPVVGTFDQHNQWEDYDKYLFKDFSISEDSACLDFGCGPGRNIVKYNNKFKYFDGVDIAEKNLENAKTWIQHNKCDLEKTKLFLCNGLDLSNINDNVYDVVMSTITLQHICVYEIRKKYFNDFFRILKKGGHFTAQMGYGNKHPSSVDYYDNFYDAEKTNGGFDVRVENFEYLKKDLEEIGFKNFNYYITDVGPGDIHSSWIFFNCQKI